MGGAGGPGTGGFVNCLGSTGIQTGSIISTAARIFPRTDKSSFRPRLYPSASDSLSCPSGSLAFRKWSLGCRIGPNGFRVWRTQPHRFHIRTEVGTMALSHWSKRPLVLIAAVCAVAGFLVGSSSSQDNIRRNVEKAEVGRYQMVGGPGAKIILDTKTARFWQQKNEGGAESRWEEHSAPWAERRQ